MVRLRYGLVALALLAFLISGTLLAPSFADGGANHRRRNQHFGVSGGNVLDASRSFCCSGTLGALLTDGSNQYILSNNHVLGRSDQAVAGEDVSQPGLIDSNCNIATVVAEDRKSTRLNSSHGYISYAVFCLKKKKNTYT